MATLRVVSWNIRAAIGPGPFPDRWWRRIDADRLRAIGAFLSSLEADAVALQEVALLSRGGELVDNAGDLARQLGMGVRYAAVRSFEVHEADATLGAGLFGNALLSRHPLQDVRTVALPQSAPDAFLSSLEADVVALQEVALLSRGGELVDNAGDLARQLGMDVRYAAVRSFEVHEADATLGAGLFGNALLSRHPLQDVRTVALPQSAPDAFVEPPGSTHPAAGVTYADAPGSIREPRCLLLASLDGLCVGTTHFSHIGSGERLLQARAAVHAFGDASPALLVGDLNAPIESAELAPFASWTDGFAEPPGDPARISTDDGYRIDQVLVRGASVPPVRVLRESAELSDHYPVVADVEW